MFSLLYLLSVVEAGWMFGFVFRVSSMCWFGSSFRVSRGQFVLLRGNSAAWRHRESSPLLCSAVVEFVAPWCYGFGTVLDLPRWLASRRASSGPARVGGRSCESGKRSFEEFPRVQRFKRVKRVKRESAHTARCFKLSGFGHRPQAAGPIRASVRGGAPPARLLFQGTWSQSSDISFIPWKIYTGLYICYKHARCKSLTVINTICGLRRQLFLETKHRI